MFDVPHDVRKIASKINPKQDVEDCSTSGRYPDRQVFTPCFNSTTYTSIPSRRTKQYRAIESMTSNGIAQFSFWPRPGIQLLVHKSPACKVLPPPPVPNPHDKQARARFPRPFAELLVVFRLSGGSTRLPLHFGSAALCVDANEASSAGTSSTFGDTTDLLALAFFTRFVARPEGSGTMGSSTTSDKCFPAVVVTWFFAS